MEASPFIVRLAKELESGLKEKLEREPINDEEDFKDVVHKICVSMDPDLLRDQVRQSYIGAYRVDFILWSGLVALEARMVKEKNDIERIASELVSHIPVFGSMYRHVIFMVFDAANAITDTAEFKKSLEARSDQLSVIVMKKESSQDGF